MNRLVKYQALQGGVFTAQKNLVDFDIMDNAQLNLANSYINLRGVISSTDTPAAAPNSTLPFPGVYNYNFNWTDGANPPAASKYKFPNEAIIKNVRFTAENQSAPLEDIRRSDVLRTQLAHFTNSDDDVYGQSYKDLCQPKTQGELTVGLGLNLVKEGDELSKYNDVSIQIPLNKFLELGNMENFPTPKLGKCRLHLELNLDKLKVVQLLGDTMATQIGAGPVAFQDVSGAQQASVTQLTCSYKFEELKYSPYYVGQRLVFASTRTLTPAGAVLAPQTRTITEIKYINDFITLTLDSAITALPDPADTLTAITANGVNATDLSVEFNQCELVLEENAMSVNMDELQYATYKNEEDNGNTLKNFSRLYNVEPECFNLLVCLPDKSEGDLWSLTKGGTKAVPLVAQYQNYRLRNNNVDLTDRDVDIFKPLYTDRLAMTLLNANLQLKNLNPAILNINAIYPNRISNDPDIANAVFIGNPLPLTPTNKLLQLSIQGDATREGVNSIQLYKHVFKSMKL